MHAIVVLCNSCIDLVNLVQAFNGIYKTSTIIWWSRQSAAILSRVATSSEWGFCDNAVPYIFTTGSHKQSGMNEAFIALK